MNTTGYNRRQFIETLALGAVALKYRSWAETGATPASGVAVGIGRKEVPFSTQWLFARETRMKTGAAGSYRGSYNFSVTPDKPISYHAPGDPELQAEGGLMRVAIRSTLTPGTVKIQAEADGLESGTASYTVESMS